MGREGGLRAIPPADSPPDRRRRDARTAQPRPVQTPPDPAMPADPSHPDGALYVFGYGSLIWRPGFTHAAAHPALLRGFHRRFCIWGRIYRGSPEAPGLVLGLDRGGACRGVAFRVPGPEAAAVLATSMRGRISATEVVYARRLLPVRLLDSGRTVPRRGLCRGPRLPALLPRGGRRRRRRRSPAASARPGQPRLPAEHGVAPAAMGVRDAGLDRIAALLPPAPGTGPEAG